MSSSDMVAITIEVNPDGLTTYTDGHLAFLWHLFQHNPAPHGDWAAAELVYRCGDEIVRRWLAKIQPEMHHHRTLPGSKRESGLLRYEVPEEYRQRVDRDREISPFSFEGQRLFHSGQWVLRGDSDNAQGATGE